MQPKNKSLKRRKYDAAFKADVLKMIANGQSVTYLAQALGISEALIYKWKQRTKGKEKYHLSGQASDIMIENQRLLQRVSQLETEREILKSDRRSESLSYYQSTDLRLRYELVHELAAEFAVESLCSVLAVSRTAYYGTGHPAILAGRQLSINPAKNRVPAVSRTDFQQT